MDKHKQKALEAAGFRFGDAADFLKLTDEEKMMVELRFRLSRQVRALREKSNLSQQQLAAKIKSSQSRIAKIEAGTSGVSLDLFFRGLFAVGGKLDDLAAMPKARSTKPKPTLKVGSTVRKPKGLRSNHVRADMK